MKMVNFLTALVLSMVGFMSTAYAEPTELAAVSSELASKTLLLDVVSVGEQLIAVGEYGHIIRSSDKGKSWQQAATVPVRSTLTNVFFLDDKTGFAVGHDAVILKTTDGGLNWEKIYSDPERETPLFAIYFSSADYGIAVGAFSYVLETSDGGKTWQERPLMEDGFDDFHLNDIFADTQGNIYIPAEFGTVYMSRDGGRNFEALEIGYEGSLWSGMGLENGHVLAWGMRGNAFMSQDNGASWEKVKTNSDRSISGGIQLEDGTIVLAALSGGVLVSEDGGQTFTQTVRESRASFAAVGAGEEGVVNLFGEAGAVQHQLEE